MADMALLIFLIAFLPVAVAVVMARSADKRAAAAERRIEEAFAAIAELNARMNGAAPQAPAPEKEPEAETAPEPEVEPEPAAPGEEETPAGPRGWGVAPQKPPAAAPKPKKESAGLEQMLGTRWAVWVGGLALALGGLFLVRYSVEQGYFGPGARIFFGALFAAALLALGEASRRAPSLTRLPSEKAAAIPPILTAAGIIAAYGTVYAAYALYGFLPPIAAFALLALVSIAATLLSAVHVSYLGLIGLLGAVLTPALVASDDPQPELLFLYLTFVLGAALFTAEIRNWRWLSHVTLGASALWPLIWMVGLYGPGDAIAIGLHLLILYGAAFYWSERGAAEPKGTFNWKGLILPAAALNGVLMLFLVWADGHGAPSLTFFAAYMALTFAFIWRRGDFALTAAAAALPALAVLATWRLASAGDDFGVALTQPLVPGEAMGLGLAGIALMALYGGFGYWRILKGERRALWATLSAAMPVLTFFILFWRMTGLTPDLSWGALALALGIAYGEGTRRFAASLEGDKGQTVPAAAYATATLAAITLALAIILQEGWLTIALALLVAGTAYVRVKLPVPMLGHLALALGAAVLIRLLCNPSLLEYGIGTTPFFNLILYLYSLPMIAFWGAAKLFEQSGSLREKEFFEAAAALLAVVLVSLEINHYLSGGVLFAASFDLLQHGLLTTSWLALSLALAKLHSGGPLNLMRKGLRGLRYVALAQSLLVALFTLNPLFTGDPVAGSFPLDALLAAYLLPAALALYGAREVQREDGNANRRTELMLHGAYALIMLFAYYSLEIRQAFQGDVLSGPTGETESYTYSLAWLIFGAGLLAAGMKLKEQALRFASLGLICLVVVKVFLFDMSNLGGALRALSFIGLGLALIGLGLFYQRVVFRAGKAGTEEA